MTPTVLIPVELKKRERENESYVLYVYVYGTYASGLRPDLFSGVETKWGLLKEKLFYNGRIYIREPSSKYRSYRKYYRCHPRPKNGERLLHRQIWVDHYGPIPFMHIVHHADGDPDNNDISNLRCIPERDHLRTRAGYHHHIPGMV